MVTEGFMGGLYRCMDWITKMVFLNLLWIFFSLLGLVIFGLMPATVAMFAVIRKWIYGEEDVGIFTEFFTVYKKEFIRSNLLGLILASVGVVFYADFRFILTSSYETVSLFYIPLVIITMIFIFMAFYIIPIFVHYEMKIGQVVKYSFFVMIMNPLSTISMVAGTFGILLALTYAPPICLTFSGNLLALIVMKFSSKSFDKVYRKSKLYVQEQRA